MLEQQNADLTIAEEQTSMHSMIFIASKVSSGFTDMLRSLWF